MTECCVDACVAVKWALETEPFSDKAKALLRQLGTSGTRLIAPPIFPSKVDSVIRRMVFDGDMIVTEAKNAYRILDEAAVEIVDMPEIRQRAREIAEQFNERYVYDATYAALAELRKCDFWTADKRFYDTVKTALTFVKYLGGYP